MPARDVANSDTLARGRGRLQIIGLPNVQKTTSLLTLPRPCLVIGCPGEKNTDILRPADDFRVRVWELLDWSIQQDWRKVRDEFKVETATALVGKLGEFKTVVFDGCHKLFEVILEAAKQESVNQSESGKPDGRKFWPQAYQDMKQWMDMGYYSTVPLVIWTAWAAVEKDNPTIDDSSEEGKKRSVWPDYMGKFQRSAVGETSIVYQYIRNERAYWQLRPDSTIKGIGLRVPPDVAATLPYSVDAKWPELEKLLNG